MPFAARDRLLSRFMFDPEFAMHVLDATPRQIERPAWNAKLIRLLGMGQAARTFNE